MSKKILPSGQAVRNDKSGISAYGLDAFREPCRLCIWYKVKERRMSFSELTQRLMDRGIYFSDRKDISRYFRRKINLSEYQIKAIADELGATPEGIAEVYLPPAKRGARLWWVGELGSMMKDYYAYN